MPVRHEIAAPALLPARDRAGPAIAGSVSDEAISKRSETVRHEIATPALVSARDGAGPVIARSVSDEAISKRSQVTRPASLRGDSQR
jgi:hypothetical protein